MKSMEWYKAKYGDGEVEPATQGWLLPIWLAAMLLASSGIQSKRWRIQKKAIRREANKAIVRGLEAADVVTKR